MFALVFSPCPTRFRQSLFSVDELFGNLKSLARSKVRPAGMKVVSPLPRLTGFVECDLRPGGGYGKRGSENHARCEYSDLDRTVAKSWAKTDSSRI